MASINIKKRGKAYQYSFEIAPQDGKKMDNQIWL